MKFLLKGTIILLATITLSSCFGYYKINYDNDDRDIVSCPTRAKPGQLVTVETVSVTDADLYCYLDGVELKPTSEGIYQFTMPEKDVEIKVVVISNGLA